MDAGKFPALRVSEKVPECRHGYDIRTVQELLGHSNVNTTMIYTVTDCTGFDIGMMKNEVSVLRRWN